MLAVFLSLVIRYLFKIQLIVCYSSASQKKKERVFVDSDPMLAPPPASNTTLNAEQNQEVQEEEPAPPPANEPKSVESEAPVVEETQSKPELFPPDPEKPEELKRKWTKKVGRGAVKDNDWMAMDTQVSF